MIKFYLTAIYCYLFFAKTLLAQSYWQQKIQYDMTINFNHVSHQFEGNQKIKYFNNSPDDLKKVYMHLYYNAFQPGSMMDVRSTCRSPGTSKAPSSSSSRRRAASMRTVTQSGQPLRRIGSSSRFVRHSALRIGRRLIFGGSRAHQTMASAPMGVGRTQFLVVVTATRMTRA